MIERTPSRSHSHESRDHIGQVFYSTVANIGDDDDKRHAISTNYAICWENGSWRSPYDNDDRRWNRGDKQYDSDSHSLTHWWDLFLNSEFLVTNLLFPGTAANISDDNDEQWAISTNYMLCWEKGSWRSPYDNDDKRQIETICHMIHWWVLLFLNAELLLTSLLFIYIASNY